MLKVTKRGSAARVDDGVAEGERSKTLLRVLLLAVTPLLAFLLLSSGVGERVCLMVATSGIFFFLVVRLPSLGIPMTLAYLVFLGNTRRLLVPIFGYASFDPLMLVVPIISLLYLSLLLVNKSLPRDTPIAVWMARLLLIMTLQIFNPLQGGISVGLAGVMFYIVPLGWYYIGRSFGAGLVASYVFRLAIGLALAGAIYGLCQTWFGFQPWEQEWMRLNPGSTQLVGSEPRPFSLYNAFAEYAHFTCIGFALTCAAVIYGDRKLVLLVPVFAVSLFLSSSRGIMVSGLLTLIVLWAVQSREKKQWKFRLALAVVLMIAGTFWGLQQVSTENMTPYMRGLVEHQKSGLSNPLDEKSSTAGVHGSMMGGGLLRGITRPYGGGLGVTTMAAAKFGTENAATEGDLSDMFVSLGVVGGCLYLGLIAAVFRTVLLCWRETRSLVALSTLAILTAEFGQWLHSGHYAPNMIIWFAVGTMDRWQAAQKNAVAAALAAAVPLPSSALRSQGADECG